MEKNARFSKGAKKQFLKTAKILIYNCSEYTPPEVNKSELNYLVAKALLSIEHLLSQLNK